MYITTNGNNAPRLALEGGAMDQKDKSPDVFEDVGLSPPPIPPIGSASTTIPGTVSKRKTVLQRYKPVGSVEDLEKIRDNKMHSGLTGRRVLSGALESKGKKEGVMTITRRVVCGAFRLVFDRLFRENVAQSLGSAVNGSPRVAGRVLKKRLCLFLVCTVALAYMVLAGILKVGSRGISLQATWDEEDGPDGVDPMADYSGTSVAWWRTQRETSRVGNFNPFSSRSDPYELFKTPTQGWALDRVEAVGVQTLVASETMDRHGYENQRHNILDALGRMAGTAWRHGVGCITGPAIGVFLPLVVMNVGSDDDGGLGIPAAGLAHALRFPHDKLGDVEAGFPDFTVPPPEESEEDAARHGHAAHTVRGATEDGTDGDGDAVGDGDEPEDVNDHGFRPDDKFALMVNIHCKPTGWPITMVSTEEDTTTCPDGTPAIKRKRHVAMECEGYFLTPHGTFVYQTVDFGLPSSVCIQHSQDIMYEDKDMCVDTP